MLFGSCTGYRKMTAPSARYYTSHRGSQVQVRPTSSLLDPIIMHHYSFVWSWLQGLTMPMMTIRTEPMMSHLPRLPIRAIFSADRGSTPPDLKGCEYPSDRSGLFLELYIIMTTIEGSGSFRDPVLCIQDDSTRRRRPGQFEVIHDRPWLMSTSLRDLRGIISWTWDEDLMNV